MQPQGEAGAPPRKRPMFQLPSLSEVQAAERPATQPVLFQPGALRQAAGRPGAGSGADFSPSPPQQGPARRDASSGAGPPGPGGPSAAPASSGSSAWPGAAGPSGSSWSGAPRAAGSGAAGGERPWPGAPGAAAGAAAPGGPGAFAGAAPAAWDSGPPRPAAGAAPVASHCVRCPHRRRCPAAGSHAPATCALSACQRTLLRALGPTGLVGLLLGRCVEQANPSAILVSKRQEGNPLLKHMKNVRWQWADIVPDYQMGLACALFLSLRYHLLKPEYLAGRVRELQRAFRPSVVLVHVDVDDPVAALGDVTATALRSDCTLICAWSHQEAARYIETYKMYENKPPDAIQGRTEPDYLSRLTASLTTVRGVNRTDVLTLGAALRTMSAVMQASAEELSACAGIGPTKVRRLYDTFHEPFRKQLHAPGAAPGAAAAGAPRPASARGASPSSVDEEEAEAVAAAAHADAGPALHMPLEEDEGEAADEDEPDVDTGQVGYER